MENIKETEQPNEVANSQEEIDNAVASAKARWNKKLEKDYVTREDYETLKTQLTQAQHELKLPKLQETFVKLGGKVEAFKDIVALNPQLFDCKDDKEIQTLIESIKQEKAYCFNSQEFNATVGDNQQVEDKKDYSNGSLLRTK